MQTETNNFRIILLTHGGADEVLIRLAVLENVRVVGVFVETDITPRRSFKEKMRRSLRYDGFWATVGKIFRRTTEFKTDKDLTEEVARELGVPVHFVPNYHDEESVELIQSANADLGVIYGTNIIKESVFSIPRLGSINLHQGLAPLYRGSAPVFWELFNGEPEVGVTVHRVAAKVDTGDIVLQETVPLDYDFEQFGLDFESFIENFRSNLKEFCAALVAKAVSQIADGSASWKPQNTTEGKRYKLPTKREKDELKRRLQLRRKESNSGSLKSVGKEKQERLDFSLLSSTTQNLSGENQK